MFALLAEHRRVLFPQALFEDLFPSGRGRPSIPVDIAASILVLQALHGLARERPGADMVLAQRRNAHDYTDPGKAPEMMVFEGVVRHIFSASEPLVREALVGALAAPGQCVGLAVAGLADESVLVGAAELAFAPLLEDPLGLLLVHRDAPVAAGA